MSKPNVYRTKVVNRDTGEVKVYSLAPVHAVVAAYEQSKGNFDTSTYLPDPLDYKLHRGQLTVACGPFEATYANSRVTCNDCDRPILADDDHCGCGYGINPDTGETVCYEFATSVLLNETMRLC